MITSTTLALEQFLKRIMLRSPLNAQERKVLLGLPGRLVHLERHHQLVQPGKSVDHATLLVDGLLGRYDQMADGGRQITILYVPGDMGDLHSVPIPHPAWGLEALAPSTVMLVPHRALRDIVSEFPSLAMAFWRDTVADASVLAKWAANLGRADASARLAHLLCETGFRMEAIGLGRRDRFALPLTQSHIADILGLTPVHVNRTISTLRRSVGLSMASGMVNIESWAGLAKIAAFDPEYLLLEHQYVD